MARWILLLLFVGSVAWAQTPDDTNSCQDPASWTEWSSAPSRLKRWIPHDELALDPHEVMAYLANPETFVAEAMGVSVADYRGWQAAGARSSAMPGPGAADAAAT